MSSELKSQTSRINGAKSRGPITLAGKQASSRNALKHGLTATDGAILLDCEDPAQFDEFLRKLRGIHSPATPAEEELLNEMAKARWRLLRMETIEVGLLNAEFDAQQSKSDAADPRAHLASAFRSLSDDSRSLALASRYEARLQRQYDRAYKTLRELQQAREAEEPEEPREIRVRWVSPDDPDFFPEKALRNEPTVDANKDVEPPNVFRSWKSILPAMAVGFYDKLKTKISHVSHPSSGERNGSLSRIRDRGRPLASAPQGIVAMIMACWALLVTAPLAAQISPEQQFAKLCVLCHGAGASGTDRGPALVNNRDLRSRSESEIQNLIRNGVTGGMPAFPLPETELQSLARFIRSLNASAYEAKPSGDAVAGERFFFGQGQCASCHMVRGQGKANGPDLSNIGRQLTMPELEQALNNPSARTAEGWAVVKAHLRDGTFLRGFARHQGNHDLQLQTLDGHLRFLNDAEYTEVVREPASLMPPVKAEPGVYRDLVAYLSGLNGVSAVALTKEPEPISPDAIERILHPRSGEWPTYYGSMSGNRYSALDQINTGNVSRLHLQWTYSLPYFGLEMTPLMLDGVMYVTAPNRVCALDPRAGHEFWCYARPRTPAGTIAGDAAKGANRGVAALGDRVFFVTDNAHLICLHRLTGALLWDVLMPEEPQHYGGTSAPLVAGGLVIAGVAGADEGIRGFVSAYKATTGQLAWRFWTIPRQGEPGFETWQGNAVERGGGSTWLTGSYDPETKTLYWPTGNPYPDTDGDDRKGDNLYTDCIVALDIETGKLRWYFQFTPHDVHDWDATEPPLLVNASFHGKNRKLLLHADRNGFFYVLDRTNGEFLLAQPFVKRLTWASGIDPHGRPQLIAGAEPTRQGTKTCPDVRGATNWYSPSFNPATGLFYVMAVENCSIYRQAHDGGFIRFTDPTDQGAKFLRALDIQTGKIVWEIPQIGPTEANYSGVLSTAGGLVFYGETGGAFAAADAKTGRVLWRFEANQPWKASSMTYMVNGRQYVATASGANVLAFALDGE